MELRPMEDIIESALVENGMEKFNLGSNPISRSFSVVSSRSRNFFLDTRSSSKKTRSTV